MRQSQPVDEVVDFDVPESGLFSDETMDGPVWNTPSMSQTFFGRPDHKWAVRQVEQFPLYLDGQRLTIPRSATSDRRQWRLVDVERFAYALAEHGRIGAEQLVRTLEIIRGVCESWGYIEARPVPVRTEEHDPTRMELYAVTKEHTGIDDLDGSEDAYPRSFALGDVQYHAELNDEHWNDVVSLLAPYIKVARRSAVKGSIPSARRADRAQVRTWANRNGYALGSRGRIPQAIMDAYLARRTG